MAENEPSPEGLRLKLSLPVLQNLANRQFNGWIAAIGKNRLPGDPPAVGGEKLHDRHDIFYSRQWVAHPLRFMKGNPFRGFLPVEKRGIHRTRADGGDRDAASRKFLGD